MNLLRWLLFALFALFSIGVGMYMLGWFSAREDKQVPKNSEEWSLLRQTQVAGAIFGILFIILPMLLMPVLGWIIGALHLDPTIMFGLGMWSLGIASRIAHFLGLNGESFLNGFLFLLCFAFVGFLGGTIVGWVIQNRRRTGKL